MIAPYKGPRPHRDVAWLVDEQYALTESYDLRPLDLLPDSTHVWGDYELVMDLLARGCGEALCWDNRPLRWGPGQGRKAWPVRVLVLANPADPVEALQGLAAWRDWLESFGAAPQGSLGSSGFSLLKARLERPLWTSMGELPPIRFTLGGRQELGAHGAPVIFEGPLRHWDIPAAYAQTLGRLRYGGWWRRVERSWRFELEHANGTLVYVHAKVELPAQPEAPLLGPLPERPRSAPDFLESALSPVHYPTGRTMQGTWTWPELLEAEQSGARILRLLEGWVHVTGAEERPFASWWQAVQEGRAMRGFAGHLAKATGNAAWGQFAIRRGRRSVQRLEWRQGRLERVTRTLRLRGGNPSQRAPDLAESVTGSVRAELHHGMRVVGDRLVSAHTDGLWALDDGRTRLEGWRSKERAERLRLVTPQELAYRRPGEPEELYVVAGVRARATASFFESEWQRLCEELGPKPHALRERDREGVGVPVIRARPRAAGRPRRATRRAATS